MTTRKNAPLELRKRSIYCIKRVRNSNKLLYLTHTATRVFMYVAGAPYSKKLSEVCAGEQSVGQPRVSEMALSVG